VTSKEMGKWTCPLYEQHPPILTTGLILVVCIVATD